MAKQTQVDKIVAYIKQNGSIEGYTALTRLGIQHLPGVVRDAKSQGHAIEGTRIEFTSTDGTETFYKRYFLKGF